MLEARLIQKLKAIVGDENVACEKQDLICYGYDATQMEFLPDVVVHPASPEEVSQVLKLANAEKIPVFPRGAGSGFSGGALPKGGGIVLEGDVGELVDKLIGILKDKTAVLR